MNATLRSMLQLSSSEGEAQWATWPIWPWERRALPGDGPFAGDEYAFRRRAAADREGELLHRLRHQTVEGESPSLAGDLDQARFPQDAQVMGDGRLRQPEEAGQVAGAHLATACELVHDRHPGRIGERRVGKECRSRWSPYH